MSKEYTEIVIIGAGLTGLTTGFHLTQKGKNIRIIEQADRVGGQIKTFHEHGFTFESGPNTGAVSYPEVTELFRLLSPDCELETAREESKRRLIWKGNRFHTLPSGLIGGITTPLFSFYDKFHILGEPFRKKGTNANESVADLATRRLGRSFRDYAVDPFVSGVYAGDPDQLVTRYALPKLYNLEQTYGSFIKGSIAKARQSKTDRDRLATKKVFSARNGLENLTKALAKQIGEEKIILSASGIRIEPEGTHWSVHYTGPEGIRTIVAEKVVTTTGAYSLPRLLSFLPQQTLAAISNLDYAPIIQASIGIKDTQGLFFNAFGGLVPSCEKKEILGILYPSACFEGRAPEKGALFSVFMGGVRHPEYMDKTEEELQDILLRAFHQMLKFPPAMSPDMIRIFRHQRAIPQYGVSSGLRFQTIQETEHHYPGLTLAGNIRNGIGMADRIRQGVEIASRL